jgi:hypothetical protein
MSTGSSAASRTEWYRIRPSPWYRIRPSFLPPGTEEFFQGKEPAELAPEYDWNGDVRLEETGEERTHLNLSGNVEEGSNLTWDQFFSAIGPLMFDEASEDALKARLSEWLSSDLREDAMDEAIGRFKSVGGSITRTRRTGIRLGTEDFGTLIIQLRALDLIQKSPRSHGVKDTQTYWCMTPWGEEHLTSLRARRRGSHEPAWEPEAAPQDEAETGAQTAEVVAATADEAGTAS